MVFSFHYSKRDNKHLFENIKNNDFLGMSEIQNYIPIYENFFSLNQKNWDKINLNQRYFLNSIFFL